MDLIALQNQARVNATNLNSYFKDLNNWEAEMKRKEAALNGEIEQELPPVRSKVKKVESCVNTSKKAHKISGSDYESWEKFDVDQALEQLDQELVYPTSLDCEESNKDKMEKLKDEARMEKEKGNEFVKHSQWQDAIKCYSRAIELFADDAIFYANRGLCYLKLENLHASEADCTRAITLDPSYVKAYQRRAVVLERLGSLRRATDDTNTVLKLEPNNIAAKKQLQVLKERMGSKGTKHKSSPATTPTSENKTFNTKSGDVSKTDVKPNSESANVIHKKADIVCQKPTEFKPISNAAEVRTKINPWKDGTLDNVCVFQPVSKKPHERSKKPLKEITIEEINLGETAPQTKTKPESRENQSEVEIKKDNFNEPSMEKIEENGLTNNTPEINSFELSNSVKETMKFIDDYKSLDRCKETSEKYVEHFYSQYMTEICDGSNGSSLTSVQFLKQWRQLKGNKCAAIVYLTKIDAANIPGIFKDSLESDTLSEMLQTLRCNPMYVWHYGIKVSPYLEAFARVKRFQTLAMFLSPNDKRGVSELLEYCRTDENMKEEECKKLKSLYEV